MRAHGPWAATSLLPRVDSDGSRREGRVWQGTSDACIHCFRVCFQDLEYISTVLCLQINVVVNWIVLYVSLVSFVLQEPTPVAGADSMARFETIFTTNNLTGVSRLVGYWTVPISVHPSGPGVLYFFSLRVSSLFYLEPGTQTRE